MSYIVPRNKPDRCANCPFMDRITYDCMLMYENYYPDFETQYNNCPLVEIPTPHGRLIDATFEENHYASMLLNPTPDVTEQDKHKAKIIIDALHMARTVIEAEGSETDGR